MHAYKVITDFSAKNNLNVDFEKFHLHGRV